jgi:prepilin-type N-terminal cleavage/methylation domain-containing protein
MKTIRRGFSLVELIVVIAILCVIAALVFPVIVRAKLSAKLTVDDSNLRQNALALSLYCEDNDGNEPSRIFLPVVPKPVKTHVPLAKYSAKDIMVSPLDGLGGRKGDPTERDVKTSYYCTWFLWEDEDGVEAWKKLKMLDPNPIVMRSYWGDDRVRSIMLKDKFYYGAVSNGKAHGIRKDLSLDKSINRLDMILRKDSSGAELLEIDKKASVWSTATSVECPIDICDGKDPALFRI